MIKRIRLATFRRGATDAAWADAVAATCRAPAAARPNRLTVAIARPDLTPEPRHDGFGLEWFTDADHVARFEDWLTTSAGREVLDALDRVLDLSSSPIVVADEVVGRGAEWLEQRWVTGGPRLKHVAIARRADGLTAAEFSERWRGRAGVVRAAGTGALVAIPDQARGQAYVQNHPRPLGEGDGEWAYDAINEVYFDRVDDLVARIDWFDHHLADADEDLVGANWFVAATEQVLA
jgi:hypothetical protein